MSDQRLGLALTAAGYAAANEAFRHCWAADREEVLSFLHAYPPAVGRNPFAVLGVGVGDGSFDLRIIAALRTLIGATAIHYIAVEPNEAQLAAFRDHVEHAPLPNVDVTFRQETAETYVPDTTFDLIHYIHSLYHMPGSEERLIRDAVAHLSAGGRLLIALSSERGGIYQMMGRFWNVIDYSFFTSGLFGQEGLRAVLDQHAMPYHYQLFPEVAIDVSECFDSTSALGQDLLNFLMQADMQRAPADLRNQVLGALHELSYERGEKRFLPHPSGVFIVDA